MDCNNLCFHSEQHCEYCKKNYDVSSELYKGKRPANGCYVVDWWIYNWENIERYWNMSFKVKKEIENEKYYKRNKCIRADPD